MTALESRRIAVVLAACLALATLSWFLSPGVSPWITMPVNLGVGFGVGYLTRRWVT